MKNLFFLFFLYSSFCWSQETTPFTIGVIDSIYSVELKEYRKLNIYLPLEYSKDSADKFQVIYLLDGSKHEDFIHVSGLVQFCNYSWVNWAKPSIVVGLENNDRRRDFTFETTIEEDKQSFPTAGQSENFIAFIEKELQPFIEKNYSASSDKVLIGQSLGGLLATEILFKKTALFNTYMIVSPSIWWDKESLFQFADTLSLLRLASPIHVYVAVGDEGKIMENDAKRLYRYVSKAKNPLLIGHFAYFKENNHADILHAALLKGFRELNK